MAETGAFWRLYEELKAGRLSRRAFIQRATALGVTLPVVLFVLQATKLGQGAAAQEAASGRPTTGTENQQRGAGGELKLLQWQAATHMSVHTSTGAKDTHAASLVTEPLMSYMPDYSLIPTLVKEVPTEENGLLAADRLSVTYNLLEGMLWSDGEPFTANDVVFTWNWIMNPENASVNIETYRPIASVEAVDDLTVAITFSTPQPAWYIPFTSTLGGGIYPAHFWGGDPTNPDPINQFRQNPIGTGPYKVDSFAENDQVIYSINENYREPNKPFFASVNLKGGGDAASTARAVLQTGDWHMAWNTQVEPAVLLEMEQTGGNGAVVVAAGLYVERIDVNFSDPDVEVDGQRSQWETPHPILTDKAVRQAMALGADRQTVSDQFYFGDRGEPPTSNILVGPPQFASPNTSWEFNVEAAKQILDEAGWVLEGDVRVKDGVELAIDYATTINPVRQKTQAVVKQAWEEIGIKVQLKQIDAGIFFDSAAGNEQNLSHMYFDLSMYANTPTDPYPVSYMAGWYSNNGENIAQAANDWSGLNSTRYHNPEYDQLYEELRLETDPERAAELFIQMNDLVINDVVMIPLVNRSAATYCISNQLRADSVALGQFETLYWNVANWNMVE
ncbi:MAG: peptide ABC transporter substrate-binding protein [Thermomicrobiales bacterium]